MATYTTVLGSASRHNEIKSHIRIVENALQSCTLTAIPNMLKTLARLHRDLAKNYTAQAKMYE